MGITASAGAIAVTEHLPNGVYGIERLRALILDLAVRGKLVRQEENDVPASILLRDVRKQQAKFVKEGTGRVRKPSPPSEPPPFKIPPGWQWVQMSEIGHDWGQTEPDGDFNYIDVGAIDQRLGIISNSTVLSANDAPSRARKIVRPGTVLYSTVRPYLLNIAVVDQQFDPPPIASTAFAIVHPFDGIDAGFVYRYLRSRAFVRYVERCQTGIAYPAINDRQFFSAWFPLAPTAEQQRIVAKVNELMTLCDALEAQSVLALEAHQTLVETLLATLVNCAHATELAANWARLESHFDTLFTTEKSIDALRSTVLELAVRGKLVRQDSNDEPALELLRRLRDEKKTFAIKGRSKAARELPPLLDDQTIFAVPKSWKWVRLGELTELITSGSRDWSQFLSSDGAKFVTMGNLSRGSYKLRLEKMHYVRIEGHREGARTSLRPGDLVVSITGDVGNMGLIPEGFGEAYINQHTAMLRFLPVLRGRFIPEVLRSPTAQKQFNEPQRGIKNSFRLSDVQNLEIPLPPLAEQHRIVAKLDELMALCDALRVQIIDAGTVQRQLADAIVDSVAA